MIMIEKYRKILKETNRTYLINNLLILSFFFLKLIDIYISTIAINEGKAIELTNLFINYPELQYYFLFLLPVMFFLFNILVLKKFQELIPLVLILITFLNIIGLFVLVNNFEIYIYW